MSFKNKIKDKFSGIKFKETLTKIKTDRKVQVYIGIAVVLVIVVIGGIIVVNHNKKEPPVAIQTYTIPENEKIFINGIVAPKQSKDIMGPANGTTPDIRVSNGQSVKSGDVLYIVKDEAAIQEISSIKTQISNLIRDKRVLKSDDPALITINNQIASLNTSLSSANAKAYTKVTSPFDGKVYLNQSTSNGQSSNSNALMTVQSTDYVMNGQISEQDLTKVKPDMTATVTILSSGDTVKGRVSYISARPVISAVQAPQDSSTTSMSFYSVVLSFDTQEGIVDGYHTQAVIKVNTDKHKIPTKAIINNGDEIYVFAEVDGILRKVNIEVLSDNEDYSVVSGNLNENDVIVRNPTRTMKDGEPLPKQSTNPSNTSTKSTKNKS